MYETSCTIWNRFCKSMLQGQFTKFVLFRKRNPDICCLPDSMQAIQDTTHFLIMFCTPVAAVDYYRLFHSVSQHLEFGDKKRIQQYGVTAWTLKFNQPEIFSQFEVIYPHSSFLPPRLFSDA